jgi:hypothetical protein
VSLAGIGTLYLHRVTQTSNNIVVRMIVVVLAPGNTLGLPAGLKVEVGVASASLDCPTCPSLRTGTEVVVESALDSSERP